MANEKELRRRYISYWPNAKAYMRTAPMATKCSETRRTIQKGDTCIVCRGYYYHIESKRGKARLDEFNQLHILNEFM